MNKLIIIAGPCVVESEAITMQVAEHLVEMCSKYDVHLIFKASYRKANRTSLDSFQGIGNTVAFKILRKVKDAFHVPILTDVHSVEEAIEAAFSADVLQIPAFLCRQTDILVMAGKTGKVVNIKKGQFMDPMDMKDAVLKVQSTGNNNVMITERGNSFGYKNVVIDFRNIQMMQTFGNPVLVDITHTNNGISLLSTSLGRAAVAAGADGIFFETHPNPERALSDGKNMIPLAEVENLIMQLTRIRKVL